MLIQRTRVVAVRLRPDEAAKLSELAQRSQRTVSGLLRTLLLQAVFTPGDVRLADSQPIGAGQKGAQ